MRIVTVELPADMVHITEISTGRVLDTLEQSYVFSDWYDKITYAEWLDMYNSGMDMSVPEQLTQQDMQNESDLNALENETYQ